MRACDYSFTAAKTPHNPEEINVERKHAEKSCLLWCQTRTENITPSNPLECSGTTVVTGASSWLAMCIGCIVTMPLMLCSNKDNTCKLDFIKNPEVLKGLYWMFLKVYGKIQFPRAMLKMFSHATECLISFVILYNCSNTTV